MKFLFAILLLSMSFSNFANETNYEIVSLQDGQGFSQYVKYNWETGDTWYLSESKFKKVKDYTDLPKSFYEVYVQNNKKAWSLIRMDKTTGKSWWAMGDVWVEIQEK